ncbi:MAG: hypothetical protein A2202_05945 [Bdellovibrionales bacterium RIFOXYA1_FULL_36_14]|nr:MAG: hypothetical protein A2202_05945 [Bdellovibrionales bacterium RIFOXYA1_FULL_36_14]
MNFLIYFLVSILVYLGLLAFIGVNEVLYVYLITYTVIILSFILLFYFGKILFKSMGSDKKTSKKELTIAVFTIIIKNALLLITLYWGYKIIGKKIIFTAGLYFIQVIILYFSIRKIKTNE